MSSAEPSAGATPAHGPRTVADTGPDPRNDRAHGRLVVLAGPTAVGKGTVVAELRRRFPDIWVSVSATTRPPRPGESDGVDYHFVDEAAFDAMVERDELLEWAIVHGRHRYGTPRRAVLDHLATGHPALLEIDLQGARQVRRSMPDALFVFLSPPDFAELARRQAVRATEDADERARRLRTARIEMAAADEFDEVIINSDVPTAASDLVDLIRSTAVPGAQDGPSAQTAHPTPAEGTAPHRA